MCILDFLSRFCARHGNRKRVESEFETSSTISMPVTPAETVGENDDDDSDTYIVARNALMKPKVQRNFEKFELLKRVHNEKFESHQTWTEAILSFKHDSIAGMIAAIKDPKWPPFLVFPCPRGPNGKGFDIDLAREILHDEQLGFRLGYAVQTLIFIFKTDTPEPIPLDRFRREKTAQEIWKSISLFHYLLSPEDDLDSWENFAQWLCFDALNDVWQRHKEGEVKAFWEDLKREGKAPSSAGNGMNGSPFHRGAVRALFEKGKKDNMKFDPEAWQKPVLCRELREMEQNLKESADHDAEKIASGQDGD